MRVHYLLGLGAALALPLPAQETKPAAAQAKSKHVSITQWIADLSHPSLAVRETATSQLIGHGELAASAVKKLCHSPDPALALRARRIFGGVFGVTPELHDRTSELIAAVSGERTKPAEAAAEIRTSGDAATAFALTQTQPEEGQRPSPLYAELCVQSSLMAICSGSDRDDACHEKVLALGAHAAGPLQRAANNRELGSAQRTHAVWLYSLVAAGERASGLAPLLRDPDAGVRREATLSIVEALRPDDFEMLAKGVGSAASAERTMLVQALARCMDADELERQLRSRWSSHAALAALVLGSRRDDDALEALAKAAGRQRPNAVGAAIVTALGEFESDKATEALASAYAKSNNASVRAAAVAALRPRAEQRLARACLTAALFDADAAVRLRATDALASVSELSLAPALIQAAEADASDALRARAPGRDRAAGRCRRDRVGQGPDRRDVEDLARSTRR